MNVEKSVDLLHVGNPQVMVASAARSCREALSSADLYDNDLNKKSDEEREKGLEGTFRETAGRAHGAVLDHIDFEFSIENLTRASTLFLCAPEYASHLQQSLRTATAERGFHVPDGLSKEGGDLMKRQFDLYEEMLADGNVPGEDARFVLPLYTKTNIHTRVDARELMHLHSMALRNGVPSEVKDTVLSMVEEATEKAPVLMKDRGSNYEVLGWYPSSQLFAEENKTLDGLMRNAVGEIKMLGYSTIPMSKEAINKAVMERDEAELANMKHYHFTFLAPMSLASFHQATRQRTWNQSIQTLTSATKLGAHVTPPKIKGTKFEKPYHELVNESIDHVRGGSGNPEELGVLPHALQVYDLIHINGWNAVYAIGVRTCTKAQWEIRSVAKGMADGIKEACPEIGEYTVPRGITYGKCPEREPCGICDSD